MIGCQWIAMVFVVHLSFCCKDWKYAVAMAESHRVSCRCQNSTWFCMVRCGYPVSVHGCFNSVMLGSSFRNWLACLLQPMFICSCTVNACFLLFGVLVAFNVFDLFWVGVVWLIWFVFHGWWVLSLISLQVYCIVICTNRHSTTCWLSQ